MGDEWWKDPKASNWLPAPKLGEQDHLEEFSALSGVPVSDILGYEKNSPNQPSAARDDFEQTQATPVLYKPKDFVYLPSHKLQPGQSVALKQLNTYSGPPREMNVEIRFRARRLAATWSEKKRPTGMDGTLAGTSAQDRWAAQWDDFDLHAEDVEADAGLTFNIRRRRRDPYVDEADSTADATKDWFTEKGKSFRPRETFSLVSKVWSDGPKRLQIRPVTTSKLYAPERDVYLELSLEVSGFFLRVSWVYMVERAAQGLPELVTQAQLAKEDGCPDYTGTLGDELVLSTGKPAPFLMVPDFLPPRLIKLGPFHRVFEITYRLPYARGVAASFSARREIADGAPKYGKTGSWWDIDEQAGTMVNKYRVWPILTDTSYDPPYPVWIKKPETQELINKNRVKFQRDRHPDYNDNWCGFFPGFNYTRAGYNNRDKITVAYPTINHNNRHDVFFSGQKLTAFFQQEKRPWCEFPRRPDGKLFPPEQIKDWLKKVLNPWGPRPGDMIVVNPIWSDKQYHPQDHVAMVHSYDPAHFVLETIEGNRGATDDAGKDIRGSRAGIWTANLSNPKTFAGIYGMGRFFEGDFDRGIDSDLVDVVKKREDGLNIHIEPLPEIDRVKTGM